MYQFVVGMLLAALSLAARADMWAPYDGKTGMACSFYNQGGQIEWRNRGGDYEPEIVASLPFTRYSTGTLTIDITAAKGAEGLVLRSTKPIRFHSREAGPGLGAKVIADGVEIPVTADAEVVCATSYPIGTRTYVSTPGNIVLAFGGPLPQAQNLKLVLQVAATYSYPGTLNVHRLAVPRPASAPVESGLAAKYLADNGILGDPDVIAVVDPDDPNWWTGGHETKEPTSELCGTVDESSARDVGFEPLTGKAIQSVAHATKYGTGCSNRYNAIPELEEVYFRYYVRLGTDFWGSKDGGKMPGITNYNSPLLCSTGGVSCKGGTKGWSLRGGFDMNNDGDNPVFPRVRLGTYAYHADQAGEYGDHWNWGPRALLELGRWYSVEQYVKVNTVGEHDGIARVWIDGKLAFEKTGLMLRGPLPWDPRIQGNMAINVAPWLIHFYGGKYPPYVRDHTAWFDNIVVAKKYIGPMGVESQPEPEPAPEPAPEPEPEPEAAPEASPWQPGGTASTWDPDDSTDGMSCHYYNMAQSVFWHNYGGDFEPDVVGSMVIERGRTGTVTLDISAAAGAEGLVLRGPGPMRFYSREAGRGPKLLVDGQAFDATADAEINCNTRRGIGDRTYISTNGNIVVAFGAPLPAGRKLELVLDIEKIYNRGGELKVHKLSVPRPEAAH